MSAERRRLARELQAPARRNFPRLRVVVRNYDDLWQADVVDMRSFARHNRGRNYILTVIDVLSKYAWALPLRDKNGSAVTAALSGIFRRDARHPRNLQTDKGKEFYNASVRELLRGRSVNHYSTYSVMKASVVGGSIATQSRLKNNMWRFFTVNGSYRWIDALPRLVAEYNARKHRTIGLCPMDVTPVIAGRFLSTVSSRVKIAAPARFRIGDPVRVSKFKTTFEKGYTPNWTTEVFRVAEIQRTNPVTYLLRDTRGDSIAGRFYEHELLWVSDPDVFLVERVLRREGNRIYVKWLGMGALHNSWIDRTAMV